jgi:hypothetical protein
MDAEEAVVIARSEARARDATLIKLRQIVQRYPIEARDAGRRLDVAIHRLMNEAHEIKRRRIRSECQLLEVARVLAIEFLETEGPPGYLRPVELSKGASSARLPEALEDEAVVSESVLRAALAVEDWGSTSSLCLCDYVGRFVVGVKGNYKRETSPGVWEVAPPPTPLNLRKLTGVEAYVQWYIKGKLAFGDTDFDEDEIRLSLRADGAENPSATPARQVASLLFDLSSESEFLIRPREKWWDVVVLTLVLRDPDLVLTHLAVESSLPQTSDHLFGGLDDARDELDLDAQVVAALWNLASRAVEYIQNPLKILTDGEIIDELDPTKPADSAGVFVTLCKELREQAEKVAASTTLETTSSQKSGSAREVEVPSYERKRAVEGLEDRVENLRRLAGTILDHAPTDACRRDLDVKTGAAISSAEGLRKAVRFARTSSDVEVIKSLDALGLATLNLQPALKTWRTHFLLGPKELAAGKSQTSNSTNPPTASSSPRFARPVHVCRAAEVLNVRASSVLRKLRRSRRKIDEVAVPKTCEFEDLVATYPERQRRLRTWADEKYPVD